MTGPAAGGRTAGVVLRGFGAAPPARPAARPGDSWCSPAEPVRISARS
ncbi:MAG: hypothetical protein QOG05_1007 [Streptosporangiaceae bacterium]|jgi:hypothetical protein|nr:hypothetical protein [Streptosporangiaceae bacterium]